MLIGPSRFLCSIIATTLVFAMSAAAQTSSSSLAGTVADATNSVIPGPTVTVTNETSGESRQTKSSASGDFVFSALTPGMYTVKVEAPGLRTLERKGNVLVSSSRLALGTLQLEIGSVNQSVEVTAQGAQVQTDSAEHSELIDSKEMQNVSIRGRDPISLLGIMAGVQKGFDP